MGGYAPPVQPYQAQPAIPQVQMEQRRTNAEWIQVSSAQQAREHIVQPNQILYFMNNNKPEFYAKSSDNFGTPTFKAFRFEEINPDAPIPEQAAPAVNPRELEGIYARISALEMKFSAITGGMNHESDHANGECKPGGRDTASD